VKILISKSALTDLKEIKEYYKEEGVPEIGYQFLTSIFEHVETLKDNPDIGRIVPEFDENNIREIIHPPFRVVYLREKKTIHIIRVWRSERILVLPEQWNTNLLYVFLFKSFNTFKEYDSCDNKAKEKKKYHSFQAKYHTFQGYSHI